MTDRATARRTQPITLESRGTPANFTALARLLLERMQEPRLRVVEPPEVAPVPPDPASSGR